MSPALNRSSAIRHFEGSNAIEICNGITCNIEEHCSAVISKNKTRPKSEALKATVVVKATTVPTPLIVIVCVIEAERCKKG